MSAYDRDFKSPSKPNSKHILESRLIDTDFEINDDRYIIERLQEFDNDQTDNGFPSFATPIRNLNQLESNKSKSSNKLFVKDPCDFDLKEIKALYAFDFWNTIDPDLLKLSKLIRKK